MEGLRKERRGEEDEERQVRMGRDEEGILPFNYVWLNYSR